MKYLVRILAFAGLCTLCTTPAFAADSAIVDYTNSTVQFLTIIASAASVFFLVKGGYLYITSSGKPESLESAKRTLKNALIGLILVLASSFIVSTLSGIFTASSQTTTSGPIQLQDIVPAKPSDGLTQVLLDAVNGFLQNLVQSATQPIVTSIMTFLTSTPDLLTNQVVRNFWLVLLGITDSLFIVVVALLGFHVMSAETLGFEQVELKKLLPRIGIAFLGANSSLFLCDYAVLTCNALVKTVIDATGGLNQAWVTNAITMQNFSNPATVSLITLVFLVIFLILAMLLLFMYVARLIFVSLGAVLSPFIFLLWTLPKFSDFAEISVKAYFVSVFVIFVHVVVIQLAASFLTIPQATGNSLLSIAVAIGLFFVLLKIPQMLMQLVFYTSGIRSLGRMGSGIMNILSSSNSSSQTRKLSQEQVKIARKNVAV
ncbi:MAG: hypothetical protein KGJ07_00335 [Patescibacteria group bacterium]|nr:hypothetical protein [Patescibacteria group bacterium]MDE2590160.1 hypothetical protein [Patescibacteria group bacterium]